MRIIRWINSWATMQLRDIHVHGVNEILGTYEDCYGDKYYAAVPHIMFISKRVKVL